jgi:hypothetical protein
MWLWVLERINSLIGLLVLLEGSSNRELPPIVHEEKTLRATDVVRSFRGHGDSFFLFLIFVVLLLLVILWSRYPTD